MLCKSIILLRRLACGLAVFLAPLLAAQSRPEDRIAEAIDATSLRAIKGNVSPLARPEYDQGEVDSSLRLSHMRIVFKLTGSQQAALDTLLHQQQDPSSPNYHKWLTPQQYAERFGLTPTDLAKLVSWLGDQGFSIDETAQSRTWVAFSGTAAQVEAAFQTQIHRYSVNGVWHYANATEPSVPSVLTDVVQGIRSLHDFRPKPRAVRRRMAGVGDPRFTSSISGSHYLAPGDFATIYHLNPLYEAGVTGAGQKIAVMGQTDIVLNDIAKFRSAAGLPANNPTVVTIPSYVSISNSGDLSEADLDLEWSGAIAENAEIIYVNAGNSAGGAFDSLAYAIDNNVAPVVSISYGGCERDFGLTDINTTQMQLRQANSQGITVVGPAGDTGATDCDNKNPTTPSDLALNGLAVDFPASSPNVTGVGGSEFYNDSASRGNAYWGATNNGTNMGSALSYIPEMAWNDTVQDAELSAGGGGASIRFTKPAWQVGNGVPRDGARDVPDVALSASADHDPYLICSSSRAQSISGAQDCVSGFRASDQTVDVIGGTSAPTPAFAGIVALINQKTGSAQGNINPVLYTLAAAASDAFHDITTGNNREPCQIGTPDCPDGGDIGFAAGPGYDQATGLGSIDAFNLVTQWASVERIAENVVAPAAARNADGRLEVFVRGIDNALWHRSQTAAGSSVWSSWTSLGGILTSDPVVAQNADGRLEVCIRGNDGALWHISQSAPGAATWGVWSSLGGGLNGDAAIARNADGRLEVFVRGTDNALWHSSQVGAGGPAWSGWTSLGGALTSDPVVAQNTDGRLEVFIRGNDSALWHTSQTARLATTWNGWDSLGGALTGDVAVARNTDGRLEVFVRGTDDALWHKSQLVAGGSGWSGWTSLGGILTSDSVVTQNGDGRLEVFIRGNDSALWDTSQTAPSATTWNAWISLGGDLASNVAVAPNADRRLEVFLAGVDSALWHNAQLAAGETGWSGWASLGGVVYH